MTVNPLQPGIQNGRYEKPVCITLKKLFFRHIFSKKCSAGGKQTGAKIRAQGPGLGFSPFATEQKY